MKNNLTNQELDQFATQIIRNYGAMNHQAEELSSPYFLTRLRARINEEQQLAQLWEIGVIKARRWLVAFSAVALLFFFGNLFAVGTHLVIPATGQVHLEQDDGDDLHSDEEALNVDEFPK